MGVLDLSLCPDGGVCVARSLSLGLSEAVYGISADGMTETDGQADTKRRGGKALTAVLRFSLTLKARNCNVHGRSVSECVAFEYI